jgi:hypothetical protein
MDDELKDRIAQFLYSFELVFDNDWDFTIDRIVDKDFIQKNGTFLNPSPGEHYTGGKGDNWANRSYLLSTYRELKAFAISEGMEDLWDVEEQEANDED